MDRRSVPRNPLIEERKILLWDPTVEKHMLHSVEANPLSPERIIDHLAIDVDGTGQPDHGTTDWGRFGKLGGGIFATLVGFRIFEQALFLETQEFEKKALSRLARQAKNLRNVDLETFVIDQQDDFEWIGEELEKAVSPTTWGRFLERARVASARLPIETIDKLREFKSNGLTLTLATDTRFEKYRLTMLKAMYPDVFGDAGVWTIGTTGRKKSHPDYPDQIKRKLGTDQLSRIVLADDLTQPRACT
jgi:hypothetical protein